MQGTIQNAARQDGPGVIFGDDGVSYTYTLLGWRDAATPASPGMRVDFDTRGMHAVGIYPIPGMAPPTPPMGGVYASPVAPVAVGAQPSAPAPDVYGAPSAQPQPTPAATATPAATPQQPQQTRRLLGLKWWYWAIGGGVTAIVLGAVAAGFFWGFISFSEDQTDAVTTEDEPIRRERLAIERPTPAVEDEVIIPTAPDASFELNWDTSDSDIDAGESFTLTVRMHGLEQSGEHGGISVSFPSLTQSGGSKGRHSSPAADVAVVDYTTGTSNVAFHQPGAAIYHREGNRQFPAEYLLVESDDVAWPTSSDRTLVLRVTPKIAGDFEMQVRGWLCADDYTDCDQVPSDGAVEDQQGWYAERVSVRVEPPPVEMSDVRSATGQIAFVSDRDREDYFDIYVMDADGSKVVRLTQGIGHEFNVFPSWSPDGRRIAFSSNRDVEVYFDIYVMDADGSNVIRLTHGSEDEINSGPIWSPDGRRIAFDSVRDQDGYGDIYVMDADGSNLVRLTHGSGDQVNGGAQWSPDGRRIAFSSDRDREYLELDIYVMDADGSNVVRLTHGSGTEINAGAQWSPDGRRIAFSSDRDREYLELDIYVMDADGSNVVRLTHGSGVENNLISSWSPDGRRIAFSSDRDREDDGVDIYMMDADGSNVVRLTHGPGLSNNVTPIWSSARGNNVVQPETAATPPSVPNNALFALDWETSESSLEAGENFTLTVRMHGLKESGEHGGISVSFPSLTQSGGSKDGHSSPAADVEVVDYTTGTSNVAFHQPGAAIYHREGNRQFPAEYLLVESDDAAWPTSSDRTLVLRVTPKNAGDFEMQIRGWLCADGYTECERVPTEGAAEDQQGWVAELVSVRVEPPSAAMTSPRNIAAKAVFQSFAVIDVDLDEYGDHDRECKAQLGTGYRLADWNDLTDYYESGGSLDALIEGLNWKDEKTDHVGVRHPRVSRDGAELLDGGRRHFFVSRHDHEPPGYFLVHEDIDDYRLSLGSWYGEGGEALCFAETF